MGLFFEKASSQNRTQKVVFNLFMALVAIDITNNIFFHKSWFSLLAAVLYIIFIIIFLEGMLNKKKETP